MKRSLYYARKVPKKSFLRRIVAFSSILVLPLVSCVSTPKTTYFSNLILIGSDDEHKIREGLKWLSKNPYDLVLIVADTRFPSYVRNLALDLLGHYEDALIRVYWLSDDEFRNLAAKKLFEITDTLKSPDACYIAAKWGLGIVFELKNEFENRDSVTLTSWELSDFGRSSPNSAQLKKAAEELLELAKDDGQVFESDYRELSFYKTAIAAIERLSESVSFVTHQISLAFISFYSQDKEVRQAALDKINDEQILYVIAAHDETLSDEVYVGLLPFYPDTAKAALLKLKDEYNIQLVAKNSPNPDVRSTAVDILRNDISSLKDIVACQYTDTALLAVELLKTYVRELEEIYRFSYDREGDPINPNFMFPINRDVRTRIKEIIASSKE